MKPERLPFNIEYLDNKLSRIAGLLPVRALDIFDSTSGEFHSQGLYSNEIFGQPGTDLRNERHGFINLRTQVLHPNAFEELTRLKGLYKDIMQGKEYAVWDATAKDFKRSDVLDGHTGYAFFMKHVNEIEFKATRSYRRDLRIDLINRYRDRMLLNWLLVMPAGLRDVRVEDGRPKEEDINKLYRKVLIASNTISEAQAFKNDPQLDAVRWTIQRNIQEIWANIMGMLGGKRGFLQSRVGSRTVAYGTANVISAMDPGSDDLKGPRSFDVNTTIFGVLQTLKGAEPLFVEWTMVNGILGDVIKNIKGEVSLINPKTLKPRLVSVSKTARDAWGTEKGRAGLVNLFEDRTRHHQPVMIDGYYAKLVYCNGSEYRLMNDIGELPADRDPKHVHPMTWMEYFYLTVQSEIHRIRAYVARYPITGIESNYPSVPYLKSTTFAYNAKPLNDEWQVDETGLVAPEFPATDRKPASFMTASPSVHSLRGLGADFDGDRSPSNFVFSKEAVQEVDDKMNSLEHYFSVDGGLQNSYSTDTGDWLLANFTGFKEHP